MSKITKNEVDSSIITTTDLDLGAWKTWSPTIPNFTLNNGTMVGKYVQIGKTVHWVLHITFGSTTAISGSIGAIPLPVTAAATIAYNQGVVEVHDASPDTHYFGTMVSMVPVVFTVTGSLIVSAVLTTTIPITFVSGDKIYMYGTYEAA